MISFRFRSPRVCRQAFTLVEILLTFALLVVLVAFSWPLFSGSLKRQRLLSGAEQVRAQWAEARYRAMKSGHTQMFRYRPDSGQYRVEPWTGTVAFLEEPGDDGNGFEFTAIEEKQLPEDVTFVSGLASFDTRDRYVEATDEAQLDDFWSAPVLFYPDGTTSTARLLIKNTSNRFITVRLRGLTGVAQVGQIISADEALAIEQGAP